MSVPETANNKYIFILEKNLIKKKSNNPSSRYIRKKYSGFILIIMAQLALLLVPTTVSAGERIWVPVRWCGVEGAPSIETPAVVNEGSSDDVLWRRHERPTDQIYIGMVNMTFRSGATSAIKNGPQSFPIIEDPQPSSGNALGDIRNGFEVSSAISACRRAWLLGDSLYLDINNNGIVNQGTDTLLSAGIPQLGIIEVGHDGTSLNAAPADIKYIDDNTNGDFDIGENIYRDENNNNTVDANDTLLVNVSGTVVANVDAMDIGIALLPVPNSIKYVDLIRKPANTYNIGYPAVQGITAVSANDLEYDDIDFPVHGVASSLGSLGVVLDDPAQYLPPGPDYTLFEIQLVAHEFGHGFSLPHGDGIDDDMDGVYDEFNEDPTAPVPGAGPNTLCDSNNVMSYCWLDNGTSGDPDLEFIGVGAPVLSSFTNLQADTIRDFVLTNVPDRIVDPVIAPLIAARVDMLNDTPEALMWLNITDFTVEIDSARKDITFSLASRTPFPDEVQSDVLFHFIIDTDSLENTGSNALLLNQHGIKTDFSGADYFGTVKMHEGEIAETTLYQFIEESGLFEKIDDQMIRGIRDNVSFIVDFPMGRKSTSPIGNEVNQQIAHDVIKLVAPVNTIGAKEKINYRVEYQTEIEGRVVDRARTPGLQFDLPVFPACRTDPETVKHGETTKVISTGLLPNSEVHLLLGDEEVGHGTTDINGSIILDLLIPENAVSGERLVTVGALAVSADCHVIIEDRDDGSPLPDPQEKTCCQDIIAQIWFAIALLILISILLLLLVLRKRN